MNKLNLTPINHPDPDRYTETALGLNLIMQRIRGGTFLMGSPESEADRRSNEKQHQVTLSDYYIGVYAVTQAQWRAVMGNNFSYFGNNIPVEPVSWDDIQIFLTKLNGQTVHTSCWEKLCGWVFHIFVPAPPKILGQTGKLYRLPTEAEWEYAARGGKHSKGFKYAGSNDLDEVAWHCDNSGINTHPVGQKKPNELGLYDMHGNVWEWCGDWYGSDYYENSPVNSPTGPTSGAYRVLRGGSWYDDALNCRVAYRGGNAPTYRRGPIGFRVVSVFVP